MPVQLWKRASLIGLALAILAFSASCKPNEVDNYTQQLNWPKEDRAIVSQLGYDNMSADEKAFIDEYNSLLQTKQLTPQALNYFRDQIKTITADKTISSSESSSFKEKSKAYNYLSKQSDDVKKPILNLGFEGDVPAWLSVASSLKKDQAEYALKAKLGIQDKTLTELEKKFLADPQKYVQQMYEYNLSEIAKKDPGLAEKIKLVPYSKEITVEDIEATEDILYLANPQNKAILEKIYGKGIARKMWPVSLERLEYKAMQGEFDVANPLAGSELTIYTRLAEFQEKYNAEMDQPGVDGPKPAVRGMNYVEESLGYNIKNVDDINFDFALMRWVLRNNAVRMYSYANHDVFNYVRLAKGEDLDVWLLFFPFFSHPDMNVETYKKQLVDFAKKAEENNIAGLYVGAEFDAWWKVWGGNSGIVTKPNIYNEQLRNFIDELADITRQNYSGEITYQEWDCWYNPDKNVNWNNMDNISLAPYIASYNKQFLNDQNYLNTFLKVKAKYNKPINIAEVGSLTITESEEAGGVGSYILRFNVHHDQKKQAQVIDRHLRLLYQLDVDAIFIFSWDDHDTRFDANKLGFGIWDYINKEPKLSFWTVYKYFK